MSKLSIGSPYVSKSASSSPNVRQKLFRRLPKRPNDSHMRFYLNEALSEVDLAEDQKPLRQVESAASAGSSPPFECKLSISKSEGGVFAHQIQLDAEDLLDDFDSVCKDALDQLKQLKAALKKTREYINHKRRQFEENAQHHKDSTSARCISSISRPDDNVYFNYSILKTALDPLTLSLRCLCNQANNAEGTLRTLQNIPWLNLTFSKKQPMAKESALPLIQTTTDLLRKYDCSMDITNAASRLNRSLGPLLRSSTFTGQSDSGRGVYILVLWGQSGMAWHTHGFPNTRFKCEFHGWTVFACKSSINHPIVIEDPGAFLQLLDGVLCDAVLLVEKDTVTGPLPGFICKALENAVGGSWNCAVGKSGCQHAVAISDIGVAETLVKLELGELEFMIWRN